MGTHTSTGEWQSFEVRMRHRRAARLLLRAEAAADAGSLDDARAALDEARSLAPRVDGLARAQMCIDAAESRLELVRVRSRGRRTAVVAGVAILVIASAAGGTWLARVQRAALPPVAAHGTDTLLPSAPLLPQLRVETEAVHRGQISIVQPTFDDRDLIPRATATSGQSNPAVSVTPVAVSAERYSIPEKSSDGSPISLLQSRFEDRDLTPPAAPPAVALPPPAAEPVLPASPAPTVSESSLVRGVLDQYASAYSRLDVDAAAAAWPRVNRPALARAFDGLASQQVSLGSCDVTVRGVTARAACHGTATWRPRVGGGEHIDARTWTFDLAKAGGAWQIVDARVQNR